MRPHDFWQEIEAPSSAAPGIVGDAYAATLPDGRILRLPIRSLADGRHGLASLIVNQASFEVLAALTAPLAAALAASAPEVVIGLPTLGLTLAAEVAQKLGHLRYLPFGSSRKFWYDEALSVPLSSITTPDQPGRRLYLDPRLAPLIAGRRVALVDDVISTGTSIVAGLRLLEALGVRPVAIGTAMLQTERWRAALAATDPSAVGNVHGVLSTPLLERDGAGTAWRVSA